MQSHSKNEKSWGIHINETQKRKPKLNQPTPVDREIMLNSNNVLLSITDTKGVIEYCNEDFVEVSGYEEYELAGFAHNIVRHPDMPRVIFKLMWERIQNKKNIIAVVKNLAKTGRYYWVVTDFVIKEDEKGNITGYKAFRKPVPRKAIETIIPLYKKLKKIEDASGMDAANNWFLNDFFGGKNTSYDDFIANLIIDNVQPKATSEKVLKPVTKAKQKSFFKRFFRN